MVPQQLSDGQSSWTIVQLLERSRTAREGPRPVKHKTETEITHQQKTMDRPSNINKPTELDYTIPEQELELNFECRSYGNNYKSILSSEKNITSIDCRRGSISSSCTQGDIFNKWKCKKGSIFYRQHSLQLSRGCCNKTNKHSDSTFYIIPRKSHFMNPKLRRKEERRLSEAKSQAQILLLSQTRTRMKTSSSDSHVRAPEQFQLIEIQNRTKEDIHTLEIFPRIIMEETFQSQPNKGMQEKNNSLSGSMETGKRSGIHSKGVSREIDENFGCEFTEQGYINDSFQDLWNRSSMRFDKERRLSN
ncbi:MAG: hypothetical protein EZS28_048038, partial [Streblomastix strix]